MSSTAAPKASAKAPKKRASHNLFAEWVESLGSGKYLANKLKISCASVTRLSSRERTPSLKLAGRIERASRAGAPHVIPSNGWLPKIAKAR